MKNLYYIIWDNGHACGSLHGGFTNKKEAEREARAWKRDMVAMDDDPKEARRAYTWEVINANDE